jgi:hypothetical protein
VLKLIILLVGGGFFLYALAKKPDWIALLLFTLIVADVNFDLNGLPLNFRATITVILFLRIFGEIHASDHPTFFSNGLTWHMIFLLVYISAISQMNGLLDIALFKEFFLRFVSAYIGYYYFFKRNNYYFLKTGIILGGLICLGDLAWTYAHGGFPVTRIYYQFTPAFEFNNHNFFGYICGTAFVFLLSDYLTQTKTNKMTLLLMPFQFLGVLLSTSRGALLAMIVVTIVLIGKALLSKTHGKKASTLITMTVVCLLLAIFILPIATTVLGIQNDFLTTITGRLIDEPLAMINRALGNDFNANNLDSMEWREEASSLAYNYYMSLPSSDQVIGIGYGGFLARDVGSGYDAHNGLLLLLIETGVLGFVIYFSMIFSFWMKVRKLKLSSPAFVSIVFILIYVTSHNKEITSFFAFLIMGSLIAEIRYATMPREEVYEEEQMAELANQ